MHTLKDKKLYSQILTACIWGEQKTKETELRNKLTKPIGSVSVYKIQQPWF